MPVQVPTVALRVASVPGASGGHCFEEHVIAPAVSDPKEHVYPVAEEPLS
jgi:hypothetical protein